VITKAVPQSGGRVRGLVEYLFGPGRSDEHTDPHVIAAYDPILVGDRGDTVLGRKMLAAELDFTRAEMRPEVKEKFVWHGVVSVDTDDGHLSAPQWEDIATTVTDHLGFNPDGEARVRWIAVHHGDSAGGNDHIHLVANLINDEGRKHKFVRPPGVMMGEVRKDLEVKHGLKLVGHDKGSGLGAYTQAETRRAVEQRHTAAAEKGVPAVVVKRAEPESVRLERAVRAAASAATDEADFLHHLHEQDVVVRPRFATGDRSTVVGMSVALPTDGGGQSLIWHGGGRLAQDLTLPAIRKQWGQTPQQQSAAVDVWHQLGVGGTPPPAPGERAEPAAADRSHASAPAPTAADLPRRVRTAAAAATGEAEFLAQLRAQGVVVRPRFATGDATTVVGMSVALPTGTSGVNLDWHGAGKLGKDLSLPALRARWGQTPEQQADAVAVWQRLGAVGKHPTDGPAAGGDAGKREKNLNPDFGAAIADINTLGAYAAALGGDDPAAAREVARQAAGVLAAAALQAHGPAGGPIGSAARRLARCAQDPRGGPALREVIPARAIPRMGFTSAALLNAATGKDQHAGWVAVVHALARTTQAVAAAQHAQHAATWEVQAATQAAAQVVEFAGRMDAALTGNTPPPTAAPRPDDGLTDHERRVNAVLAGRRTKTIHQIVASAATTPPRNVREQGSKKPGRDRGSHR